MLAKNLDIQISKKILRAYFKQSACTHAATQHGESCGRQERRDLLCSDVLGFPLKEEGKTRGTYGNTVLRIKYHRWPTMPTLDDKEECFGRVTEIDTGHLTARGAMAEETRVYLSGIPFLMNEEWLRMHLLNSDIRRPWKVVILRKGWHRSKTQWANAFLWYNSKEEAQAVATSLDGLTLPGWWRPFKAELAWTDPNWHWLSGCKYCTNLYVWRIVVN